MGCGLSLSRRDRLPRLNAADDDTTVTQADTPPPLATEEEAPPTLCRAESCGATFDRVFQQKPLERRELAITVRAWEELPESLPSAASSAWDDVLSKERWWRKCMGSELEPPLENGAIALVDAGWLVTLAEDNGVLPPRQAAPPEAFLSLEEVRMMTPMGHCAGYERINLRIICVSHTWLQPEHPDPFGYNLRRLGRALKLLLESPHHCGRWGVFIDWISLYQACRAPDGTPQSRTVLSDGSCGRRLPSEDVLFRQALRSLGLFYSHMATHVFKLTSFPVGYPGPPYELPPVANLAGYDARGWCYCESSWASIGNKCPDLVIDLHDTHGADMSGVDTGEAECWASLLRGGQLRRDPPISPARFEAELATRSFTNGKDDKPLVAKLYREGFTARMGVCARLVFAGHGWGPAEVATMAETLSTGCAHNLEMLVLLSNPVGDGGALAIAGMLPHVPKLRLILMGEATVGTEATAALRAACEARAVDLRMISKVGEVMWWGLCASVHSVHDALGEGALE